MPTSLNRLFWASVAIALGAIVGPWLIVRAVIPPRHLVLVAAGLTVALIAAWTIMQVVAIVRFGRRGLVLLVGLPFVLWWPLFIVLVRLAIGNAPD